MTTRTTSIEWTQSTWNPTIGCDLVSPGCTHCYAMGMAWRIQHNTTLDDPAYRGVTRKTKAGAVWTGVVRVSERAILKPLGWKKPRTIFVNSMSDLFHKSLAPSDIARVWATMALANQHTYQVLTKRPEYLVAWLRNPNTPALVDEAMQKVRPGVSLPDWPLKNVWVGTSVEDQTRADERIHTISQALAAVRFLSVEPLLGPVRLLEAVDGESAILEQIDWVIVGGESGPKARPMHPAWAKALRDECAEFGIAFFFKQIGSWAWTKPKTGAKRSAGLMEEGKVVPLGTPGSLAIYHGDKKAAGRQLDGKFHDEMPRPRNAAKVLSKRVA